MATKRKATVTETGNDSKKPKGGSLAGFLVPKTAAASNKFDKKKWVGTLTPEQKKLLSLEIQTMHESWLAVLKDEIVKPTFLALKKFLGSEKEAGKTIYPMDRDIYSWSRHTPLDKVRVLVLGQDPYHGPNQAHGLSFSVRAPTPPPPSLKNIFIALKKDYPDFLPPPDKTGSLVPWAEQGVLMLNACLTVRRSEANSHQKRGWEEFTQKVVEIVCKGTGRGGKGVVVLAWGSPAQKRVTGVDKVKNLVLSSVHPSPLSASRGFFDCGHFKKANEWLSERYGETIDWNLGDPKPKKEEPATEQAEDSKEESANEEIEAQVEKSEKIMEGITKESKKEAETVLADKPEGREIEDEEEDETQ